MDVKWIDDVASLKSYATQWLKAEAIYVDTEFEHRTSFFPLPALLQICDGKAIYLIDAPKLEGKDLSSLKRVLEAPSVLKVLHSARQDLMIFWLLCEAMPRPMFDVQIANMLVGGGIQESYQSLARDLLQIDLPKTETVSDWLKRPLSDAQLNYAADDVRYLMDIKQKFTEQLKKMNRLKWLRQECDYLCDAMERSQVNPEWEIPPRLARVHNKSPIVRATIKQLGNWRERRARAINRPRTWVLPDKEMLKIAQVQPKNARQLIEKCGFSQKRAERSAKNLLKIVVQAAQHVDKRQEQAVPYKEETDLMDRVHAEEKKIGLCEGAILFRTEAYMFLSAYKNNRTVTTGRVSCPWRMETLNNLMKSK